MSSSYMSAVYYYYDYDNNKLSHKPLHNMAEAIGPSINYYSAVSSYWYPQFDMNKINEELCKLMKTGFSKKAAIHLLKNKYPFINTRYADEYRDKSK